MVVVDTPVRKNSDGIRLDNIRAQWTCSLVQAVEYMLRDAAAPPTIEDAYPADALAALRNMQARAEDLLAAAVRAGWLTREQRDAILREARMGA